MRNGERIKNGEATDLVMLSQSGIAALDKLALRQVRQRHRPRFNCYRRAWCERARPVAGHFHAASFQAPLERARSPIRTEMQAVSGGIMLCGPSGKARHCRCGQQATRCCAGRAMTSPAAIASGRAELADRPFLSEVCRWTLPLSDRRQAN